MTEPAFASLTAISNGSRKVSFSSLKPRCTGACCAASLNSGPRVLERRQQIALSPCNTFWEAVCARPPAGSSRRSLRFAQRTSRERPAPGPALLATDGTRLFPDLLCRALHQLRVPGRAVVERGREQRGVFAQQPHRALVEQRRNAKPRLFHHHALQTVSRARGFRVNDVGAERTGDLPDAQF